MTVKTIYLPLLGYYLLFVALSGLQAQNNPTLRQFVGANLNAQDDLDKARRFAHVREFHQWTDDISTASVIQAGDSSAACPFEGFNTQKLRWNPSYNTNRYINYDDFYAAFPQKVLVVTQGAAPAMTSGYNELTMDTKPICQMDSPYGDFNDPAFHLQPAAYRQQTIWQSLFAARYGAAPTGGFLPGFEAVLAKYLMSPDNLGLGRGVVRYMENFNEQDASWHEPGDVVKLDNVDPNLPWTNGEVTHYFFTPAEYAAMLSANYDGHCNTFKIDDLDGGLWGIKNISPETQVVMSGTADLRQRYIKEIIAEFSKDGSSAKRPCGTLPFDVLNMHHYPTTGQPAMGTPEYNQMLNGARIFGGGEGVNPEALNEMLKQRILNTVNDPILSGTRLWITELGYDSHDAGVESNVKVPVVGPFDRQTVQGQWLTRCIFEVLATKSVERLYLYHLQDKPGTGQFTHTGVVDISGKPKKSWYHVMTQLNVLGDYNYVETPDNSSRTKFFASLDPANPGTPLEYDVPRIYKFLKGGNAEQPTFALWAPSKNNVTYSGLLFIPNPEPQDPNYQITNALKIEVQDLDENGKRTLIPSGDIQSGNYGGKAGYFIKNLKITETPQYIKLNNKYDVADPTAESVFNLRVSQICCGAAKLSWDMSIPVQIPIPGQPYAMVPQVSAGTILSTTFQVYYAPQSAFSGTPTFDLSRFTTVEERLPGHFRECIITGLEPGIDYYFFVVPVRKVGLGESIADGLLPDLAPAGGLREAREYTSGNFSAGCGGSCLLSLGTDFTVKNSEALLDATNQAFGLGESDSTKCANLKVIPPVPATSTTPEIPPMIIPTGGIYMDPGGPLSLTYTVTFAAPKLLEAIYFVHGTGGPAKVRIEVLEDCCDQWKFVHELDILSFNNVFSLANSPLNFRRIEQIRFTITRYPYSNPSLPRIYFCATPAPDVCATGSNGPQGVITGPSDLLVTDIDTRSATMTWTPGQDKDLLPLARYRLRYGVATDAQGNIVSPKETSKNANGGEATLEKSLNGLTPGTQYFVDLDVDPIGKGCTTPPAPVRTTFTTKDVVVRERSQRVPNVPAALTVQPNPASQTVTVRSAKAGYTNWTLTYSNGVHIRGGQCTADDDLTIDVSTLSPGLYIITFMGGQQSPVARTFVVQR